MTVHIETPTVRPPTAAELDPAQTSAPGTPGIAPPAERTALTASTGWVGGGGDFASGPGGGMIGIDSQEDIMASSRRGVAAEQAGLQRGTPEWDAFIQQQQGGPAQRPNYQTDPGVFRAEERSGELRDFASSGMQTPGRFDSALVSDIGRNIDLELANKKLYAGAELDEFASQRGLVGSNIEFESRQQMLGGFERERSERMTAVQMAAANAWAADRASAADVGFRSGEFERSLGGDRENANRFGTTFGQGQYEFDTQFGQSNAIQQRALDLQEQGMNLDEAYRQAQSEISSGQFTSSQDQQQRIQDRAFELQQQGMDQDEAFRQAQSEIQESQFASEMSQEERISNKAFELQEQGMSQDEAFRYAQLAQDEGFQQQALDLQQQGMSLDEAYRYAELAQDEGFQQQALDLQSQGMDLDEAYRRTELAQQDAQFAQSFGLSEQEFAEQTKQFGQSMAEQVASRLQQAGQFSESLAAQLSEGQAGREMEKALRNRAMDLQEEGMTLDEAYRQAALAQEGDIQTRALDLEEQGMSSDDAYRYAALAQDEEFQREAQRLQQEGMNLDEAYRNAALSQADRQFAQSTSLERLRIVMEALASDEVDNDQVRGWLEDLGAQGYTPKETGSEGVPDGGDGTPEPDLDAIVPPDWPPENFDWDDFEPEDFFNMPGINY